MPANLEKTALYGIELWGYMGNKTSGQRHKQYRTGALEVAPDSSEYTFSQGLDVSFGIWKLKIYCHSLIFTMSVSLNR